MTNNRKTCGAGWVDIRVSEERDVAWVGPEIERLSGPPAGLGSQQLEHRIRQREARISLFPRHRAQESVAVLNCGALCRLIAESGDHLRLR